MGYNVVGLDAIYNTVPCATKDKHGNAVFYPINLASSRLFYELPNVQHTIDTVMLAHTFRYMTDPAYVLGELRRRYNPNTFIILSRKMRGQRKLVTAATEYIHYETIGVECATPWGDIPTLAWLPFLATSVISIYVSKNRHMQLTARSWKDV